MSLRRTRSNEENITTSAAFSTSTTAHELTVPAGKKYLIKTISVDNDVNSTITVKIHTAGGVGAQTLLSEVATLSQKAWPQNSARNFDFLPLLGPAESIRFEWGTAQSTGVEVSVRWEEISI